MGNIQAADFDRVDMRVGRIIEVVDHTRAQKPSYKVKLDFGPDIGVKGSSVRAKESYSIDDLMNRLVIAVVNLEPRNIAGFQSEVLILGVPAEDSSLSILGPTRGGQLGGRVY